MDNVISTRHKKNFFIFVCIIGALPAVFAEEFDIKFLENIHDQPPMSDLLSIYSGKEAALPGKYRADIYVNETWKNLQDVNIVKTIVRGKEVLLPCFTLSDVKKFGVDTKQYREFSHYAEPEHHALCVPITDIVPDSNITFDVSQLAVKVSIPQAALLRINPQEIPSELWNDGVNALITTYNFTGSQSHFSNNKPSVQNYYLNLQNTLNIGAWRIRNHSTYNKNLRKNKWKNISNYAQRGLTSIKSQLKIGDTVTLNTIFDSFSFRGVQLSSDAEMLPYNQRQYAPVIRGIAKTNALLTIKQSNYIIYQSNIPPGPFTVDNLYPSDTSGDILVIVKESDGTEQRFIQPYASVPILKREGDIRYALTAGEYRTNSSVMSPKFIQTELIFGLPFSTTAYGGFLGSNDYYALNGGIGKNLGLLGALSADLTHSQTKLINKHLQGNMLRIFYTKYLHLTGTYFRVSTQHRFTSRYYNFQEAIQIINRPENTFNTRRNRIEITVNQSIERWGAFFVNHSREQFWYQDNQQTIWQIGYNNNWNKISYGLSLAYRKNQSGVADNNIAFNIAIPLTINEHPSWINYNYLADNRDNISNQFSLTGNLFEDNSLSYTLQQSYRNKDVGYGGNLNLNYRGQYANYGVGYNYDKNMHQLNYSLQGGMLLHAGGITFAQPINDTAILVETPGASGIALVNNIGIKTDWLGYAVIPYATPYQINKIEIDANSLGDNIDLKESIQQVVPTKGALVKAKFSTFIGYRVILQLFREQNKGAVPFGAQAYLMDDDTKSESEHHIVGDEGKTYLSGLPAKGTIKVVWGKTNEQQCYAEYVLPHSIIAPKHKTVVIPTIRTECK